MHGLPWRAWLIAAGASLSARCVGSFQHAGWKRKDVPSPLGTNVRRFRAQAPLVRGVPWFDKRVSEGTTSSLGPGALQYRLSLSGSFAAATLKRSFEVRCESNYTLRVAFAV